MPHVRIPFTTASGLRRQSSLSRSKNTKQSNSSIQDANFKHMSGELIPERIRNLRTPKTETAKTTVKMRDRLTAAVTFHRFQSLAKRSLASKTSSHPCVAIGASRSRIDVLFQHIAEKLSSAFGEIAAAVANSTGVSFWSTKTP